MPELREIGKGSFCELKQLKEVYLNENVNLTTIHKDAFLKIDKYRRSWPPIRKLFLNSNYLRSVDMELLEWEDLEEIDLSNNPWKCQCDSSWMTEDLLPNILYKLSNNNKVENLR